MNCFKSLLKPSSRLCLLWPIIHVVNNKFLKDRSGGGTSMLKHWEWLPIAHLRGASSAWSSAYRPFAAWPVLLSLPPPFLLPVYWLYMLLTTFQCKYFCSWAFFLPGITLPVNLKSPGSYLISSFFVIPQHFAYFCSRSWTSCIVMCASFTRLQNSKK